LDLRLREVVEEGGQAEDRGVLVCQGRVLGIRLHGVGSIHNVKDLQGYLAHQKQRPPPPSDHRRILGIGLL